MPRVNVPPEYLGVLYPDSTSPRRSSSSSHPYQVHQEASHRQRGHGRPSGPSVHPPAATYPLRTSAYRQPRPESSTPSLYRASNLPSPPPHVLPESYRRSRPEDIARSRGSLDSRAPPEMESGHSLKLPQWPPLARSDPLQGLADVALAGPTRYPSVLEIHPLRLMPDPNPNGLPQVPPGAQRVPSSTGIAVTHETSATTLQLPPVISRDSLDDLPQNTVRPLAPSPPPRSMDEVPAALRSASANRSASRSDGAVLAPRPRGNPAPAPKRRRHKFGEIPDDGYFPDNGPFANLTLSGPTSPRQAAAAPTWQETSRRMLEVKSLYSPPTPPRRPLPLVEVTQCAAPTPAPSRVSSMSRPGSSTSSGPPSQVDEKGSGSTRTSPSARPDPLEPERPAQSAVSSRQSSQLDRRDLVSEHTSDSRLHTSNLRRIIVPSPYGSQLDRRASDTESQQNRAPLYDIPARPPMSRSTSLLGTSSSRSVTTNLPGNAMGLPPATASTDSDVNLVVRAVKPPIPLSESGDPLVLRPRPISHSAPVTRLEGLESSSSSQDDFVATQISEGSQLASEPMTITASNSTIRTVSTQESILASPVFPRLDTGRSLSFHLPPIPPFAVVTPDSLPTIGLGPESQAATKRKYWADDHGTRKKDSLGAEEGEGQHRSARK